MVTLPIGVLLWCRPGLGRGAVVYLFTAFCMCLPASSWLPRSLSRKVGVVMGMVLVWLHLLKVAM